MGSVILDPMQSVHRLEHVGNDARKVRRPFCLAFLPQDQVLTDLDQRVCETARRGMSVKRVTLELTRIGHVVANDRIWDRGELLQ
jgi:hypothetical protein